MKKILTSLMAIIMLVSTLAVTPTYVSAADNIMNNRINLYKAVEASQETDLSDESLSKGTVMAIAEDDILNIAYCKEDSNGYSFICDYKFDCNNFDNTKVYYFRLSGNGKSEDDQLLMSKIIDSSYNIYAHYSDYESVISIITQKDIAEFESVIEQSTKAIEKYIKKYNTSFADLGFPYIYGCNHKYNIVVTPADVTKRKDGSITKKCSICNDTKVTSIKCPSSINVSDCIYSGKNNTPKVVVRTKSGKVVDSKNYKVSYSNNKKVGQAKIVITFVGNSYKGALSKTFKILPKSTSILKISSKSASINLEIKKQIEETTGYEIYASTDKNFNKSVKILKVKNSQTKIRHWKLNKNKKYYVKVRTYKTIKKTKYYSKWSKVKTIKVK